ncbi:hypothetical protein L1887_42070 [Cichorium endivia]|nr:hypothetical protein L1887_42070 [Cichorium endivia]
MSTSTTTASPGIAGSNLLPGKVVAITGASRGIGRACALACAAHGATGIVVHYFGDAQTTAEAESLQQELAELGAKAVLVAGDISDAAVGQAVADAGRARIRAAKRVCIQRRHLSLYGLPRDGSVDVAQGAGRESQRRLLRHAGSRSAHEQADAQGRQHHRHRIHLGTRRRRVPEPLHPNQGRPQEHDGVGSHRPRPSWNQAPAQEARTARRHCRPRGVSGVGPGQVHDRIVGARGRRMLRQSSVAVCRNRKLGVRVQSNRFMSPSHKIREPELQVLNVRARVGGGGGGNQHWRNTRLPLLGCRRRSGQALRGDGPKKRPRKTNTFKARQTLARHHHLLLSLTHAPGCFLDVRRATMPGNEFDDVLTNQPVVIDNGSGSIKAGFAGQDAPKCFFPQLRRSAQASARHGRRHRRRPLHRTQGPRAARSAQDQVSHGTRHRHRLGGHGAHLEPCIQRRTRDAVGRASRAAHRSAAQSAQQPRHGSADLLRDVQRARALYEHPGGAQSLLVRAHHGNRVGLGRWRHTCGPRVRGILHAQCDSSRGCGGARCDREPTDASAQGRIPPAHLGGEGAGARDQGEVLLRRAQPVQGGKGHQGA